MESSRNLVLNFLETTLFKVHFSMETSSDLGGTYPSSLTPLLPSSSFALGIKSSTFFNFDICKTISVDQGNPSQNGQHDNLFKEDEGEVQKVKN